MLKEAILCFFVDAQIEYPLNSMSSIASSMSWFVQPLMALIFFVELVPCTVVEGVSMGDAGLGWSTTTKSFSTTLLGALGESKSSSDELLYSWASLAPHLLFLIWSIIENLGMAPTTYRFTTKLWFKIVFEYNMSKKFDKYYNTTV